MLARLVDEFIADCRAAGLSCKTIDWYAAILRSWMAFVADRDWHEPNVTREFIASLQMRPTRYLRHPTRPALPGGLLAFTVRGYVRGLKRFFNWLVKEEKIADNPLKRVRMPKAPRQIPRAISADDFNKLLAVADTARDRALLLILRDTGCRAGEVCGLLVRNLDLKRGVAAVCGKGNQERFVFLSPATCEAIQKSLESRTHLTDDDRLFTSSRGNFKPGTVHKVLRRLATRAAISGRFNPHSLRHGFARDWLLAGGDLASLSDVLGHSDIQTTKIYASFAMSELKALHKRYSPLARG